jgi:hypothetical protein
MGLLDGNRHIASKAKRNAELEKMILEPERPEQQPVARQYEKRASRQQSPRQEPTTGRWNCSSSFPADRNF